MRVFVLGAVALIVLVGFTAFLYWSKRNGNFSQVEWLLFYCLIGFTGAVLFYLIAPTQRQSFRWKNIAIIAGPAAVALTLMLVVYKIVPQLVDDPLEKQRASLGDLIEQQWCSGMRTHIRIENRTLVVELEGYPAGKKEQLRQFIQEKAGRELAPDGIRFLGAGTVNVVLMDSPRRIASTTRRRAEPARQTRIISM